MVKEALDQQQDFVDSMRKVSDARVYEPQIRARLAETCPRKGTRSGDATPCRMTGVTLHTGLYVGMANTTFRAVEALDRQQDYVDSVRKVPL